MPDHKCDSRFGVEASLARSLADGETYLLAPFIVGSFLVCFSVWQIENTPFSQEKRKSSRLWAFTLKQNGFGTEVRCSRQRDAIPSFWKRLMLGHFWWQILQPFLFLWTRLYFDGQGQEWQKRGESCKHFMPFGVCGSVGLRPEVPI